MPETLRIFLTMAALLAAHVIADFGLLIGRTRSRKAVDHEVMQYHLLGHAVLQGFVLLFMLGIAPWLAILLTILTVLLHWGTDYGIWYLYRKKFMADLGLNPKYWNDYWYWIFVGGEQCCHFLVLGGVACLSVL